MLESTRHAKSLHNIGHIILWRESSPPEDCRETANALEKKNAGKSKVFPNTPRVEKLLRWSRLVTCVVSRLRHGRSRVLPSPPRNEPQVSQENGIYNTQGIAQFVLSNLRRLRQIITHAADEILLAILRPRTSSHPGQIIKIYILQ